MLLNKNLYIKKLYVVFLKTILNKYIKSAQLNYNSINFKTSNTNVYNLLLFLNKHSLGQFKVLVDIICYDSPNSKYRFSIIYNLLSIDYNYRIKVLSKIKESSPIISTVTALFPGSGWLEREVWDFFGVYFINNPDLRRILTDYGFKGYPLRKDFPLTGFIEVVYDDSEKQVVYKKLELAQDFRNFYFKNSWKQNDSFIK